MFPPTVYPEVSTCLEVEDSSRCDVRSPVAGDRTIREFERVLRIENGLAKLIELPMIRRFALGHLVENLAATKSDVNPDLRGFDRRCGRRGRGCGSRESAAANYD